MSGGYPPEGSRWLPTVDPGKGEYETAIVIPEVYLVVVVVAVVRVCSFDHSTPPCVPPFPFPPLLPWGQPALPRFHVQNQVWPFHNSDIPSFFTIS
jgi:hypothetical protein